MSRIELPVADKEPVEFITERSLRRTVAVRLHERIPDCVHGEAEWLCVLLATSAISIVRPAVRKSLLESGAITARTPRRVRSASDAVAELAAGGYEPMEDFPGLVSSYWSVRCVECKQLRTVRLNDIRQGRRCAHSAMSKEPRVRSEEELALKAQLAVLDARGAGFEPMVPYPGSAKAAWKMRCVSCERVRSPQLSSVRRGLRCQHKPVSAPVQMTAEQAVQEARWAGYTPQEPYSGFVNRPWKMICMVCHRRRRPSLYKILTRGACRHSGSGGDQRSAKRRRSLA